MDGKMSERAWKHVHAARETQLSNLLQFLRELTPTQGTDDCVKRKGGTVKYIANFRIILDLN
jgi:hypothetical protein